MRNNDICIKFLDKDFIKKELNNIGFDKSYVSHAIEKNNYTTLKIFDLRPQEASILKQSALSLGFDAAVNKGVIDCSIEYSDCIISGSISQFKKLSNSLSKQPFRMKKIANEIEKLINFNLEPLIINDKEFNWKSPYLMGILNITEDSFSDGGKFNTLENASKHFVEMLKNGVSIIDIGAESTRPGYSKISPDEEIKRLIPILKELRQLDKKAVISVDTRNYETAKIAIELGANIINDISFAQNKNIIELVNQNKIPYILTHNKKIVQNCIDEVFKDLYEKIELFSTFLILDVGIGFEKTIEQNFELINRINEFKSLKKPILVGHSRKSFLSKSFNLTEEELDFATQIVSSDLIKSGTNILRVHETAKHKLLLDVIQKIKVN